MNQFYRTYLKGDNKILVKLSVPEIILRDSMTGRAD